MLRYLLTTNKKSFHINMLQLKEVDQTNPEKFNKLYSLHKMQCTTD